MALLAIATGCAAPPVLTPTRLADRGLTPLARTAEVRLAPSIRFEQRRSIYNGARQVRFDRSERTVSPNGFIAFSFSDAGTLVLPAALLWSPVVDRERGYWLTLGAGVYGAGFGSGFAIVDSIAGVWGKRRFDSIYWLSLGLVLSHVYREEEGDRNDEAWSEHFMTLTPGAEIGLQSGDHWAISMKADHGIDLLGTGIPYSRALVGATVVPVWWLDLGLHGGAYLHRYPEAHADPALSLSAAARW